MLGHAGRLCFSRSVAKISTYGYRNLISRQMSQVRHVSGNSSSSEDEVILETHGNKCVITLNRPKALNALNLNMIRKITPVLKQWENEEKVLIIIHGAGEKAFCAGGDVRSIIESRNQPTSTLFSDFFREEYQLNYLISTLQTPYIALIDGITMGGGVGLSVHGYYRVSSEKTLFAMPETAIGFVPEVGGTYFLPRLTGKLGMFLALTGYRLKGADVYHAGISTHAVNNKEVDDIKEELLSLKMNSQNVEIEGCLAKFTKSASFLQQPFSLEPHLPLINDCFSAPSVEEIISRLQASSDPFAKDTLVTIRKMSPFALKVTKRALDEGSEQTLAECLQMEYRLSQRFVADHDFPEGVRALLIDKDQNPKWKPSSLEECTPEKIESYFEPVKDELHL